MIGQTIVVDLVVLAAALWLVWSFGPESLRRAVLRKRRVAPAYDAALHADGLDGRREEASGGTCGEDCGCR